MGVRQRIIGLIYVLLSLANILTTLGMGTLLLALASDHALVAFQTPSELHMLIRVVCAATLSEFLDDCIVSFITGYRIAISEGHINFWIAPCTLPTFLMSLSSTPALTQTHRPCCGPHSGIPPPLAEKPEIRVHSVRLLQRR